MDTGRYLPIRERPLPGESLASLLCRTAAAMGYDNINLITRLLAPTYRPHQSVNWTGPGPHLDRLATLFGLSPEDLLQRTVHRYAAALVLRPAGSPTPALCDHKTAWHYFAFRTAPVCPVCLAEDGKPYERLVWSFRPLSVCTRHGCLLLAQCPTCQRALPRGRKDSARCRCGAALAGCPPTSILAAALVGSRNLEQWLRGGLQAVSSMPSAVAFWWAGRLAQAVGKMPRWVARTADRLGIDPEVSPALVRWTVAVEAFESWPEGLYQLLDAYQQTASHRGPRAGLDHAFGFLLRDTAYLERLGYAAPAEAVRRYLLERYTESHVNRKVGLFRTRESRRLHDRHWYTCTEAAMVLHLAKETVANLVRRGVLEGQIRPAGSKGRTVGVVSRVAVEALQRALETGLAIPQAGDRLGTGRAQVFALIQAGILKAVRTCRGWVILLESVQAIETLCRDVPPLVPDPQCWLPLRQATRIYGSSGLNLARVLELVQAGRVAARRDCRHPSLRGLWLARRDLEAQLPEVRCRRRQERGYTLCRVGRVLLPGYSCREPVLKKWIRLGFLRAQRRGRVWAVLPEEIDRFRGEYCLAGEACALLQVSRATLARWEVAGYLTPVYGRKTTRGAGFSLYRRADVLTLQNAGGRTRRQVARG